VEKEGVELMESLNASIYPAIFYRRSTRSYSDSPIAEDKLDSLRAFMAEVVPLLPSEQAAFEIQPYKKNTMKISAYAKKETASLINLAFMLQQMDLFIQANGMGALWNATVRATKPQSQGLPYRICLLFGVANNPIRTSISQFDRKQPGDISNKPELPLVEAVRLAPSARNSQPWYLACKEGCIDFYCAKGGLVDKIFLESLHWIDIGIAVCHAALVLQQEELQPAAAMRSDAPEKEGYIYGIGLDY
jgi:hypothetical protein